MRFRVLGPVQVRTARDAPVRVPELKVRRLLAVLLTARGRTVPADRLIDVLWDERPPTRPRSALRAKVSQLRRALDGAAAGGRAAVVSEHGGYRLGHAPGAVDADRFEALVERARTAGDPRTRAALLGDALDLWRGPALADFAGEAFARPTALRLEEARLAAQEEQARAHLELGAHDAVAADLAALVDAHPLRERARAAHMLALYRSGRRGEALEGYARTAHLLHEEAGVEVGRELAALYRAILADDPGLRAPLPVPSRAGPPAPVGALVGREGRAESVRAVLVRERLVTLTGPGGIGKTRLALEAARTAGEPFPDGVWWVEADPGPPGSSRPRAGTGTVARAVADAVGLRDPAPGDPVGDTADRVARALAGSRGLLVLDGCERVLDGAADLVGRVLGRAPGLCVLATGREPLGVPGEHVYVVPPLEVPPPGADTETIRAAGAVALFLSRAPRVREEDLEAVAALCRRLDGLPLALELAATRVRSLGVRALAERLDDRLRLLDGGPRRTPARQRTLRATLDWSWDLLGGAERRVLRRLAVHADGCSLEAVQAVCAEPDEDAVELLERLVSRSWVAPVEEAAGPRYRLAESVALYCAERLAEAGEAERVAARHSAFFTDLAERTAPLLYGPGQRTALLRLDAESADLRVAVDTALRTGDGERAVRLVDALAWYRYLRGRHRECRRDLERVLEAGVAVPGGTRARWEALAAGLRILAGEADDPVGLAGRVLAGCEQRCTARDLARARWFLAVCLFTAGERAVQVLERALDGFAGAGDRWGTAAALVQRAWHRLTGGEVAQAGADAQESLRLFADLGDRWGLVQAGDVAAAVAQARGDLGRARRLHSEGLRTAEQLGLWHDVPWKLAGLGRIALLEGDLPGAREYHARAARTAREHDDHPGLLFADLGSALVARRAGDLEEAQDRLLDLRGRLSAQDRGTAALVAVELGYVAQERGDVEAALAHRFQAWEAAGESGDPRAVALVLEALASAGAAVGRHRWAGRLLGAARALRDASGAPLPAAERADADRAEQAVRAALGGAVADAAVREGAAAPLEDLVP
ncbi:hypothetical protein SUDANB121_00911 [Nocardiopsis dassonvillei]|uniref:BTAD domain-containing putative transcriptional regulator n=1 Tax=Nocardiopsis dassonvillei TaxID=2014 RepID=UPI003F56A954